jgi:hypothetical protein
VGKRSNSLPSALKHGAYSGTALLPGEDPLAFKELYDGLIAEFAPAGPLEEDIVADMARRLWRKQNLLTYKLAALAKDRSSAIRAKYGPCYDPNAPDPLSLLKIDAPKDLRTPDEIRADEKAAEREIRKELGDAIAFVEMGDAATVERLLEDLALIDRLDGMIDRCVKRLLMVRGAKSMSLSVPVASSVSRKRLSAA